MRCRFVCGLILSVVSVPAQPSNGRWDGTVDYGDLKVPFRLDLSGSGAAMAGAFVNGEGRVLSSSGSYMGKQLTLTFGDGAVRLEATLEGGELKGQLGGHAFSAAAYCTCGLEGEAGPAITGQWEVAEKGWRLDVRRTGEDTLVMLWREGRELGPLMGRFDGLAFQLHYFDGSRAAVLELEERKDGGLDVVLAEPGQGKLKGKAVRVRTTR